MINSTVLPIGCVKAAMNIKKTQMDHDFKLRINTNPFNP